LHLKFVDIDSLVGGILRSGAEYGLSHRKHFFTRLAGGGLVSPAQFRFLRFASATAADTGRLL
jgi:hypothetical protein